MTASLAKELCIHSEIGRLRSVLLHEPGREVDLMVPVMMEELLFDDILFGDTAREEHRRLRRVLQLLGVETVESRELLEQTLEAPVACEHLLASLLEVVGRAARTELEAADPATLARMLVEGIRLDPRQPGVEADDLFEVTPVPNWCFQRDPQVVVGNEVLISSMAAPARWREALLSSAIFQHHPRFADHRVAIDLLAPGAGERIPLGPTRPSFEGGDLLVLSHDVIAMGHSERTNRTGVRRVAEALAAMTDGPRWLIIVKLPLRRAYMHLDTVLTPIDRDACLVYPPIAKNGGSDSAHVYEIDLASEDRVAVRCADLFGALQKRGIDWKPIACGGDDPLTQQREQWTDGANAFAVAPGCILLYDRNLATADALDREGFTIVTAEDVLLGRTEVDIDSGQRTCILVASHEMSRARGGPHCLTHPLARDAVD